LLSKSKGQRSIRWRCANRIEEVESNSKAGKALFLKRRKFPAVTLKLKTKK
jgi:hypothetical protein